MDTLPELGHLSALEKDAYPASVSPSHSPKANRPTGPRTGTRLEASVGRAGDGSRLHPNAVGCAIVNTGERQGLSAYQTVQQALAPIGSLFEPG
jgi:hypothetical protein